jgi:hypothetical protein
VFQLYNGFEGGPMLVFEIFKITIGTLKEDNFIGN